MSTNIGNLEVLLSANTAALTAGFTQSNAAMEQMIAQLTQLNNNLNNFSSQSQQASSSFSASWGKIAGVVGTVGTALAGISFAKILGEAAAFAGEIGDISEMTGASIENLSALRDIADKTGGDFKGLTDVFGKFAANLKGGGEEGAKAEKALKAIGVTAKKDVAETFYDVAVALQDYEDGLGKMRLMQDLGGKSAAALIPYMNDIAEAGLKNASLTKEQRDQADKYEKALKSLGHEFTIAKRTIALEVIPVLMDVGRVFVDLIGGPDKGIAGAQEKLKSLAADGSIRNWARSAALEIAGLVDTFGEASRNFKAFAASLGVSIGRIANSGSRPQLSSGLAAELVGYLQDPSFTTDKEIELGQQFWVSDGNEGMAEFNAAMKEARTYVAYLQKESDIAFETINEAAGKTGKSLKETLLAQFAATDEAARLAAKGIQQTKKSLDDYGGGAKGATQNLKNDADELEKLLAKIWGKDSGVDADFFKNLGVLQKMLDGTADAEKRYVDAVEAYIKAQPFAVKATAERTKKEDEAQKAVDELSKSLRAEVSALEDQIKAQRESNEEIGLTGEALGELKASRYENLAVMADERREAFELIGAQEEQITSLEKLAEGYRKLAGLVRAGEVAKASADAAKKAADEWNETNKQIGDSLTDALMRAFEDGKGFGESFRDTLKNLFKTLVLKPIIQPIAQGGANFITGLAQNFFSNIFGGNTGNGALGALMGENRQNGGFNWSSLSSFSSLFTGGGGAAATYVPTFAGSDISIAAGSGSGAGWGSMMGTLAPYAMAGGAGYLIGGNGARWMGAGERGQQVGSYAGTAGAIAGYAIGSYVGTAAGVAGGMAAGAAVGTEIFPVIGTIIGAIVGALAGKFSDPDGLAERTAQFASEAPGQYTSNNIAAWGARGESAFGRFGTINDRWFSGGDMGEALKLYFQAIEKLDNKIASALSQDKIDEIARQLNSTSEREYRFGHEHGDFSTALSDYLDERYGTVYSVIDAHLGKLVHELSGSLEERMMALDTLVQIDFAKVPEHVMAVIRRLEKLQDLGKLTSFLEIVGDDLPEAIKKLFMSTTAMGSGAMNTLLTYAQALGTVNRLSGGDIDKDVDSALAQVNTTPWKTFDRQSTALEEMVLSFDDSVAAANALSTATGAWYQSMLQAVVAIEQAKTAIHDMFSDSRRTIEMTGMDDQETYDYLQAEADRLRDQLLGSTDATEIQRLAELINRDYMEAFGLIDPNEEGFGRTQQEFIENLDELDRIVAERLGAIRGGITDDADTRLQAITDLIAQATADAVAAASDQSDAASTQQSASQQMMSASNSIGVAARELSVAVGKLVNPGISVTVNGNRSEINA